MGQRCFTCRVNRRLVSTEPVTKDYEIQSLECPRCRSVVRLAVPVKCKDRVASAREAASLAAAGGRRDNSEPNGDHYSG
jgi:hypothetical protein